MSEHDSNRRNAPGAALGRTLIIANPVAQSGAGKRIAGQLQRFLALYHHDNASFELVYTEHMGHAVELAESARDYDSASAVTAWCMRSQTASCASAWSIGLRSAWCPWARATTSRERSASTIMAERISLAFSHASESPSTWDA